MLKNICLIVLAGLLQSCSPGGGVSVRPDNAVIIGINYVGITVSDLDRATQLYTESFGVKEVQSVDLRTEALIDAVIGREDIQFKTRLLRSSNAHLRLFEFQNSSVEAKDTAFVPVNGPGIAHVCVQVDQLTEAYPRFLAGGGTAVGAEDMTQLNPRNPVFYAYARDQDQTMFEIEHVDIAKLNLDKPVKNKYRIRHVALASPDIDRIRGFYSVLLEQKKPRRLGRWFRLKGDKFDDVSGLPKSEIEMAFFNVRNMELEIAQYYSHPTTLPASPRALDALGHSIIVYDVSNIDAAREKLIKAGGVVVHEAISMDGMPMLVGRDPDGNLLGFQPLAKSSPLSSKHFDGDGT